MNGMDWDDLRIFLALARAGSLSAAARVLSVEHSTVARRLTRLEKTLRCKLFNRLARGWALTPEGRELEARAALLESKILSIRQGVLQTTDLAGPVIISVPPALLSTIIVPLLQDITRSHPDIDLQFIGEIREADLGRGEADIALRMSEPTAAELVTRVIGHISYGLYGTAAWLHVPADERRFIGFLPKERFFLAALLEEHVAGRRYVLRTNDIHVIKSAAIRGLGIALMADFFGANEPGLVPIDGPRQAFHQPISLVMQRDVRQSPRIRVVADFLAAKLRRLAVEEAARSIR
ncbi:MAG: LysR family transcriptional regulator [Rhizorhabdus sp.]